MQKNTRRYVTAIALIISGILVGFMGDILRVNFAIFGYFVSQFHTTGILVSIAGIAYLLSIGVQSSLKIFSPRQEDFRELRQRVQNEPEKVEPVWELGRAKLELYFDRNLSQINYIFWLSVIVMIVGFSFILYGISQTLVPVSSQAINATHTPSSSTITPAIVGSVAGVITEFIGATFLFIYRSTIQQAASHIKTLERINSVGMAMKILDTISNESKELQDKTKAEMVRMLLSENDTSPVKNEEK